MRKQAIPYCWLLIGCMVGAVGVPVGGCALRNKRAGVPIERRWESPETERQPDLAGSPIGEVPEPATQVADELPSAAPPMTVLAVVNGSPVTRAQMVNTLLASHGLDLLEQLVLLAAVRQRAKELSLNITPADVQAAHDRALRRIATPISNPDRKPLHSSVAERLLQDFLDAKNLSRSEWDRRMELHAYLHKIAGAEVAKITITEKMLREEYTLGYGERVQIRHIQLSSLDAVARARKQLAEKKDYELVARQLSENAFTASQGGLMPPFTRSDPAVPPLIREMAFNLETGQVSPAAVNENASYHLIRVERRFPASDVKFEEVDQETLRRRLCDRLTRQRENELQAELFQSATANIDIRDPQLRRQFHAKHQPHQR